MIDHGSTHRPAPPRPHVGPPKLIAGIVAALVIPLIVLGFFLVQWLVPHEGDDRLVGVKLAQPGVIASPPSLLSADDVRALNNMANDGSLFGMPIAVRLVRVADPMSQTETQSAAGRYYASTPIETERGARDGLLFYIAVPMNQPGAATAAFVPGEHFFPQMGLTQERLDRTLEEIVNPRLQAGNYADAAKQGAAWIVYDQLFGTMPRIPLTHGQEVLNRLTTWVLAPIVAVLAAGYLGLALWTRRAARRNSGRDAAPVTSTYAAAAIARGRVDDAASTGAVLALLTSGSLRLSADGRSIELGTSPDSADPFARAIWERVRELGEASGGAVPMRAVSRLDDAFAPQLAYLETRMRSSGGFSSRIPALNRVTWGTGFLLLLVTFTVLVATLVSRSAAGLIAVITTLLILAAVTWWAFHRSQSTDAGIRAAASWLARQREAAQAGDVDAAAALRTYQAIVKQEDLIADPTAIAEAYGAPVPRVLARMRGMSIA